MLSPFDLKYIYCKLKTSCRKSTVLQYTLVLTTWDCGGVVAQVDAACLPSGLHFNCRYTLTYYVSANSAGGSFRHRRHLYITNSLGFHVVHQNRFYYYYL